MTDDLRSAVEIIRTFVNSCEDISTGIIRTEDGVNLYTDWGYFEDGLNEIERYLKLNGSEVSLTDREILQLIDEQPTVDAIPISFIEKKIESIRQYLEKHGGEIDIEEFIDGLISKAVAYEKLIEEWREENGQAD